MPEVYSIKVGAICTPDEAFLGLRSSVHTDIQEHGPPCVYGGEFTDLEGVK